MSEQKHAPFPWKTSYDGHGGICIEAADGSQVGFVSSSPHQEANARLIEHAPALLLAAKAVAFSNGFDAALPQKLEDLRAICKALSS